MNALKGLDFKRSATTLFSMYIKYLMYSFFTGWLFHSAWQSLVLAVTKIRFRRFRRFSKVCQEPFPAFEQVSSQKVESIQKLNFRLGIKIVQLWPWFNSFDTGSPSVTNIQFRRFSKVNQEPFPAFELVSSQKVESIQWYIRGIGTTKIFVVHFFLMQFLLWFFLMILWNTVTRGKYSGNVWQL